MNSRCVLAIDPGKLREDVLGLKNVVHIQAPAQDEGVKIVLRNVTRSSSSVTLSCSRLDSLSSVSEGHNGDPNNSESTSSLSSTRWVEAAQLILHNELDNTEISRSNNASTPRVGVIVCDINAEAWVAGQLLYFDSLLSAPYWQSCIFSSVYKSILLLYCFYVVIDACCMFCYVQELCCETTFFLLWKDSGSAAKVTNARAQKTGHQSLSPLQLYPLPPYLQHILSLKKKTMYCMEKVSREENLWIGWLSHPFNLALCLLVAVVMTPLQISKATVAVTGTFGGEDWGGILSFFFFLPYFYVLGHMSKSNIRLCWVHVGCRKLCFSVYFTYPTCVSSP